MRLTKNMRKKRKKKEEILLEIRNATKDVWQKLVAYIRIARHTTFNISTVRHTGFNGCRFVACEESVYLFSSCFSHLFLFHRFFVFFLCVYVRISIIDFYLLQSYFFVSINFKWCCVTIEICRLLSGR